MSAYSTLEISRDRARGYLVGQLSLLSDEMLGRLLTIVLEPRLYDARVVPFSGKDDAELSELL